MHLLIKGYYGYKNLGDELIIFSLLNRIEERFNPDKVSIECGDEKWMEEWILRHKAFLIPGIMEKLEFITKPNRIEKIKICLGLRRKAYDYIIFGGGEVIDESRSFLYRGRNLFFQYRRSIKQGFTAIVGGLGTNKKRGTDFLQDFFIKNADIIILRDKNSFELTKKILEKSGQNREEKCEYDGDLTLSLLEETKEIFMEERIKSERDSYFLINFSPLCDKENCLKKIKKFSDSQKKLQPIYIACNKIEDENFYSNVQEILPNCEYFDWTQANIAEILKLFYFTKGGIGARLHFLYILKFFGKEFIQLHKSHKIQVNLSDID